MTEDELIQREIDLDIKVTPEIEDAFYFIRLLEEQGDGLDESNDDETLEEYEKRLDAHYTPATNAGRRIAALPDEERRVAIHYGTRMYENLKKYGVTCKAWEKH